MKVPHVSEELIEYLDKCFHDRVPNIQDTEREIWVAVGCRKVISHLKALHENQVKRALENKVISRS